MPVPFASAAGNLLRSGATWASTHSSELRFAGNALSAGNQLLHGNVSGSLTSLAGAGEQFTKDKELYLKEQAKKQNELERKLLKKEIVDEAADKADARQDNAVRQQAGLLPGYDNSKFVANNRSKVSLADEMEEENANLLKIENDLNIVVKFINKKVIDDRKLMKDSLSGNSQDKVGPTALLSSAVGAVSNATGGGNDDNFMKKILGLAAGLLTAPIVGPMATKWLLNSKFGSKAFNFLTKKAMNTVGKVGGRAAERAVLNAARLLKKTGSLTKVASTVTKAGVSGLKAARHGQKFGDAALKTLTRAADKEATKALAKAAGKQGAKTLLKSGLKTGLKYIPGVGTVAGVGLEAIDAYSLDAEKEQLMRNKQSMTGQSLMTQATTQFAGSLGAWGAGAAAGALIGSVVPVIGTAAGALVGGIAGALLGSDKLTALLEKMTSKVDENGVPNDPSFLAQYNAGLIDNFLVKKGEANANKLAQISNTHYLIGRWLKPIEDHNTLMKKWNEELDTTKLTGNVFVDYNNSKLALLKLFTLFNKDGNYNGWFIGDVFNYLASPLPKENKIQLLKYFIEDGLYKYGESIEDNDAAKMLFLKRTGKTPADFLEFMRISGHTEDLSNAFFEAFQMNTPEDSSSVLLEASTIQEMLEEEKRAQRLSDASKKLANIQLASGALLQSTTNIGNFNRDNISTLDEARSDIVDSFEKAIGSVNDAINIESFDDGLQNYLMNSMLPELGDTLFSLIKSTKEKEKSGVNPGYSSYIPVW